MTTIDVDTSPLQAAREWRGIGLVAAALQSGLPVAQAEALEQGDTGQFQSIDEMIASAVVYGASLGIGRDEATALLDRTISGPSGQVEVRIADHDEPVSSLSFSDAVRERSARIAQDDVVVSEPIHAEFAVEPMEAPAAAASVPLDEPLTPSELAIDLPDVPGGPTPEQAIAASTELHLDDVFGPEAPWEDRGGQTGELEQWVASAEDFDADSYEPVVAASTRMGLGARLGSACHSGLERIVGTERADRSAEWTRTQGERVSGLARAGREKLRASEHATLIVAIGAGALLIALLVGIGGALGGGDDTEAGKVQAGTGPLVQRAETPATTGAKATDAATGADAKAKADAKPAAMLPPTKLRLNVYNAGHTKGYAKEVAAKLQRMHYRIGQVENAKGTYAGATVIYPKGLEREARVIARRMGIRSLDVAPGSTKDITVVVV
jgi:hypothetical protein